MVDTKLRIFLLLFLLLLLTVAREVQCFQEKKVLSLQELLWRPLKPESHTSSTCLPMKSRREKGATILEMKHPGSCSTSNILMWHKKQKQFLILDNFRVHSLQSRFRSRNQRIYKDSLVAQIPLTSGIGLMTLNYIVTVELGGQNKTLIVDTGSDLTWVQCQPCSLCYNQQDPLFNPSASPTYNQVLCNSTTCQSLQFATGNPGWCASGDPPTCNYVVNYGDGSYTRGEIGIENLNLGSTLVRNFIFGCGRNNKGLFGGASGLMGLGRSDLSLVSQTSYLFERVFSYCLPTTDFEASGSLALGGNSSVYKNTTPISYTRLIPVPQLPTFYFVNLTGISIGGVSLASPSFGQGGVLFDSGTVITRLPPSIYTALKSEFVKQFSGVPSAPGFLILDTCFNLSGYQEVEIPTIKLQFEGNAELDVDENGIFYFVKSDASQVCLAVASLNFEDETPIIGNYQQRNQRVVYDAEGSKLGMAQETCSFD